MKNIYLGLDIGGTKTAVVLMTENGEYLNREQFKTQTGNNGWKKTIEQACLEAKKFEKINAIKSIGISCGGPLNNKTGYILSPPNLPGWDKVPITNILSKEFGVPAFLENDANAGALAEWKYGAGIGSENMVFLTFGTGLGAGLILNRRLFSGTNGLAGEAGHVGLEADGPIGFHKRGSFEGFCSGTGLAQMMVTELVCLAEEIGKKAMEDKYKNISEITGRDVVEWAHKGDELALKVVTKSGQYLGKGLAILIDLLNPEKIVIGSMGVRLGELLFSPARKVIEQQAIPEAWQVCEIVPAGLGEKIGDYAALSIALCNS